MLQTSLTAPAPISLEPAPAPRLLMFDSGLGGLSVLQEVTKHVPTATVTYVADDAAFPYGAWEDAALVAHVVDLLGTLIERHRPDLVVIACNTASTLVLPPLRERYAVPFVGTVPAIKPAAQVTKSGLVSVLATPGTVARDYTRQLIESYAADVQVMLVGSTKLAGLAEAWLKGERVDLETIRAEIAPCFRTEAGARTDTIVLGCTHYPLLIDQFRAVAPWDVNWIDGAAAIARRVAELMPARNGHTSGRIIFTSGAMVGEALRQRLSAFGLVA